MRRYRVAVWARSVGPARKSGTGSRRVTDFADHARALHHVKAFGSKPAPVILSVQLELVRIPVPFELKHQLGLTTHGAQDSAHCQHVDRLHWYGTADAV